MFTLPVKSTGKEPPAELTFEEYLTLLFNLGICLLSGMCQTPDPRQWVVSPKVNLKASCQKEHCTLFS